MKSLGTLPYTGRKHQIKMQRNFYTPTKLPNKDSVF